LTPGAFSEVNWAKNCIAYSAAQVRSWGRKRKEGETKREEGEWEDREKEERRRGNTTCGPSFSS